MMEAKSSIIETIASEIRVCTRCGLHKHRQNAVPGEGPGDARILIVGEGPGRQEDIHGRPFVGRSGGILNDLLGRAGLKRDDLFITSVVKCRPPHNRAPRRVEWETCINAHLRRQMEIIKPAIVCLLGAVATTALLGPNRLPEIRGTVVRNGNYAFFPTYHPAAAGRSRLWHQALSEDLKKLYALVRSTAQ